MPGSEPLLSIGMATYGQPEMMAEQEKAWLSWPLHLQKQVEILVGDDCGDPPYEPGPEFDTAPAPPFPEGEIRPGLDLRVYRADKNIPWNQPGMRNLLHKEARAPWHFMIDPDMLLTAENLARIMDLYPRLKRGIHYKPQLRQNPREPGLKPYGSPNLYIVHRDDFWMAGGYNEDFCGAKGYSDVILHRTLADLTRRIHLDRIWLRFVSNQEILDADVRTLNRNLGTNKVKFNQAVQFAARNSWKLYADGVRNHIRFPWHRVR
jgi:hypothetical protein